MVSVFLSHSSKDKPFVRELADALAREGDIEVWLDEREIAAGDNIVGRIGDGLGADFVLLVLSPDSVDSKWVKEEWTDAFWEQTNSGTTKLVLVLYRDCNIPKLARNKKYIDLRTNQPEGFRKIRSFLLTQKPVAVRHVNQLPSRPPIFVGREEELAGLRERLGQQGAIVPVCELAGQGKTTLALEFAHRYEQDFEAVYWLSCQSQNLAAIASELLRQLDWKVEGDLAQIVRELRGVCSRKRCLLILDNVDDDSPGQLIPGGAASVLVTTRFPGLRFLRFVQPLALPLFTEGQCFELFTKVIGAAQVARHQADCKVLFERIGYLPIAVSVSAGLIRYNARYTIANLVKKLPADVTALMVAAVQALTPEAQRLLGAMAACAPEGFRLDLASEIAGFDEDAALEALQESVARSLVEEIDRDARRYRLHALVRVAAGGNAFRDAHAEKVRERFRNWELEWKRCEEELPDFQVALERTLQREAASEEVGFSGELAYCGFELARRVGRLAEGFEICGRMQRACEANNDRGRLQAWLGNQALILKAWGRLDEALALHKREEAICEELGNRDGLQACYGNQALILKAWGRLDEALALHKKEEAICDELGNKDGLQRSYGNQALILKAWERLDEALALHKKEEAICEELGDRDGLQASYGNQALILQDWGRLDEALALHKKQEAICEELGNRDGLGRSYGNQALIVQAWGRLDEALALHKKEEAICQELGDRDGLQASYGNQALILQDWGRLDEALELFKKKEVMCEELGNKRGLGICNWAWGLLERELGNSQAELERLATALAIFQELRMPRERDAVEAELAKTRAAGTH